MHYIPNVNMVKEMLAEMGISKINELFGDIPKDVLLDSLKLPDGKSEYEVERDAVNKFSSDSYSPDTPMFIGAGLYHHVIPAVVDFVSSRAEFLTSYTPYQPEISQGMLQAMFEYQSMMASLTGMEVVNSSMYDGSTSLAEAFLMAKRITGKNLYLTPESMFWEKRMVAQTYGKPQNIRYKDIPFNKRDGQIDIDLLNENISSDVGGLYIESPNFFGIYEESLPVLKEIIGEKKMLIVGVNPLSLAIQEAPGLFDADIVIGEGQPFGLPVNFGGPLLGIFATKKKYIRKMPGRLIGLTKDTKGKRAFTMTLQTREQHIRRSKATSNICSNEALATITAAAYMAALGEKGLKNLAIQVSSRARWLSEKINDINGFKAPSFSGYFFNEFLIDTPYDGTVIVKKALSKGVIAGLPIGEKFPNYKNNILISTTEVHTSNDYNRLLNVLKEITEVVE